MDDSRNAAFEVALDREGAIVIGGNATLLFSSDGGVTFRNPEIKPSIKYGWIYGIAPVVANGFVAVGKGGWIYLSDRKATSWKLLASE